MRQILLLEYLARLPRGMSTELSCQASRRHVHRIELPGKSLIEELSFLYWGGGRSTLSKLMVRHTFKFPLNLNFRL